MNRLLMLVQFHLNDLDDERAYMHIISAPICSASPGVLRHAD